MYIDCLNRNQIKVLKKLGFLKRYGFYLTGGTALAFQMGHRRSMDLDFYDIYFLLKQLSLEEMFKWVKKKYPKFNIYSAVRGLTYFDDAEKKKFQRRTYLFQYVSWPSLKKILIEKTNEYWKKCLK